MKKLFSLALMAALAFAVAGCQKSEEQKAADSMKEMGKAATNAIPK